MSQLLFVYGTLKRGDVRAHLLANQQYLGEATTEPRYRLYSTGPYPALVEADVLARDGQAIKGELYRVDADCLQRLDLEEGVDEGLYERLVIALNRNANPALANAAAHSYFYLYPTDGLEDCGDHWLVV